MNDVLQRVSGESQPVPLWRTASTDNIDTDDEQSVFPIFTFTLNLKVSGHFANTLYSRAAINCFVFLIFHGFQNQNVFQGIKITATTPSSTAVRLETGSVNLEVSNNEPVTKKESSKESNIDSKLSKATLYDFQRQFD